MLEHYTKNLKGSYIKNHVFRNEEATTENHSLYSRYSRSGSVPQWKETNPQSEDMSFSSSSHTKEQPDLEHIAFFLGFRFLIFKMRI